MCLDFVKFCSFEKIEVAIIDAVSRLNLGASPRKRFANRILTMILLRTVARELQAFQLFCLRKFQSWRYTAAIWRVQK